MKCMVHPFEIGAGLCGSFENDLAWYPSETTCLACIAIWQGNGEEEEAC